MFLLISSGVLLAATPRAADLPLAPAPIPVSSARASQGSSISSIAVLYRPGLRNGIEASSLARRATSDLYLAMDPDTTDSVLQSVGPDFEEGARNGQGTPDDPSSPPVHAGDGDATLEASAGGRGHAPGDPWEGFNRAGFAVQQDLDKAILRPVALGYKHAIPKPIRSGVHNFLVNLTEPIVFLNDLLQLRPGRAIRTVARFAVNTTLGLAGVIDVAKDPTFKLPHHSNSFGDTLGYYGVKPGPYLFLPLVGPTNLRDLLGWGTDGAVLPLSVGFPFDNSTFQIPTTVADGLDQRANADRDLQTLFKSAVDPYATLRSVYLQNRAGEIRALKMRGSGEEANHMMDQDLSDPLAAPLDDPLEDPGAAPAASQGNAPELDDPLVDPAAPAETTTPEATSPEAATP